MGSYPQFMQAVELAPVPLNLYFPLRCLQAMPAELAAARVSYPQFKQFRDMWRQLRLLSGVVCCLPPHRLHSRAVLRCAVGLRCPCGPRLWSCAALLLHSWNAGTGLLLQFATLSCLPRLRPAPIRHPLCTPLTLTPPAFSARLLPAVALEFQLNTCGHMNRQDFLWTVRARTTVAACLLAAAYGCCC